MVYGEQLPLFEVPGISTQRQSLDPSAVERLNAITALRQQDGLCGQYDPAVFVTNAAQTIRVAKQICGQCPLLDRCQSDVLNTKEPFGGVLAGLSEVDRAKIWRAVARSVKGADDPEIAVYIQSLQAQSR